MSTDNLHALYAPSDIIPAISINSECGDHNSNYVIIPLPREILSNAQSQAKEAVYPLDSRFINLYNTKTKKYSLPYLNNAQEYRKLYIYYLKNISITKFALEGSISTWEIDNSRQGTSRKYKCVWSTKQCCEARSFPTITSYSARIS